MVRGLAWQFWLLKQGPRALVTIAGVAQSASKILRAQLKGKFSGEFNQVNEDILSRLERGQLVDEVPAPLLPLYRPSVQKYLISWFSVVPKTPSLSYQFLSPWCKGSRFVCQFG